jgi:subtilisin family serine protease
MSRIGTPWHLTAIDLDRSLSNQPTGRGVTVAVLDTGIDGTHPDFGPAGQRLRQYGFDVNDNLVPLTAGDHDWGQHQGRLIPHGTHVAGLIGSTNNAVGVALETNIVGIVFAHRPRHVPAGRSMNYARMVLALDAVAQISDVRVANLSSGLQIPLDRLLHLLVHRVRAQGILPVVAVGNHAHLPDQPPDCPGDSLHALTVGSTNWQSQVGSFIRNGTITPTVGPSYVKPDLVAPGEEV